MIVVTLRTALVYHMLGNFASGQCDLVTPVLQFAGQAEEALQAYVSIFEGAEIRSLERYGLETPDLEGVLQARLCLYVHEFLCLDSSVPHDFTFTPAISFAITCATAEEIDRLFAQLAEGGAVPMPPRAYPFNTRFGWVADRFGVSWQLRLDDRV